MNFKLGLYITAFALLTAAPTFAQSEDPFAQFDQPSNVGAQTNGQAFDPSALPQLPTSGIQDNAQLQGLLEQAQIPPEERQAELERQARELAFDAALNGLLPMRPEEIRKLLEAYDESTEAAQTPVRQAPEPEVTVQTVALDPGARPPVIKTSPGFVTTLSIFDMTGEPWAVQDVSWGGDFEVIQPEAGGHVLRITPLGSYERGNISMRLVELKTPITFILETGLDTVQYRFDARIPEYGPNAVPEIMQAKGGISAKAGGNETVARILDNVPPGDAVRLNVDGADGRSSAFLVDGQIYLRTPHTLISPAWSSSANSMDGTTVYIINNTPVVLLSDNGRLIRTFLSEDEG